MKILITGANGFVGRNLCESLPEHELYRFDIGSEPCLLEDYCRQAEFVYHLAGVNRPENTSEFMKGNFGFTSDLLNTLKNMAILALSFLLHPRKPRSTTHTANQNALVRICLRHMKRILAQE